MSAEIVKIEPGELATTGLGDRALAIVEDASGLATFAYAPSCLHPTAFGQVPVGALVGTGAGDVVPPNAADGFQIGVESGEEGIPIVYRLEPRLERRSDFVKGRLHGQSHCDGRSGLRVTSWRNYCSVKPLGDPITGSDGPLGSER